MYYKNLAYAFVAIAILNLVAFFLFFIAERIDLATIFIFSFLLNGTLAVWMLMKKEGEEVSLCDEERIVKMFLEELIPAIGKTFDRVCSLILEIKFPLLFGVFPK
jgi:hypothetical protein